MASSQQDHLDKTLVHHAGASSNIPKPETGYDSGNKGHAAATSERPQETYPLDTTALGELFFHPSTRIFDARLAASIPVELLDGSVSGSISKVFDLLFLSAPYMYESICLASSNDPADSVYHTRADMHGSLFAYILKRISCLPFIENDGYIVNNHFASATDAPFIYFLHTLLKKARLGRAIPQDSTNLPATVAGHGSTLVIDDPRAIHAFEIFTQHPMKFYVQVRVDGRLLPEEYALIWCQDIDGTSKWDLVWEYLSKGLARILCPEASYEF